MASLRIDNTAFATNLNFDGAEHMISAIPEEYRWGIETLYMVEEAIKQEFCCKGCCNNTVQCLYQQSLHMNSGAQLKGDKGKELAHLNGSVR
ncbi:MAG: hypothetical protein QXW72_02110 [Conexivisphaerales archaeon]